MDNARGRLLTLGAGLFAAGALIFTARNFVLSRRTVELSRRTFELTEQGQVADRYTKAIEQLGSDKLDVRIGGVYALERVARDSARDHPTVMDVLTAFIREHSHEQWPPSDHPTSREQERSTRPDVQAALTVVGRRNTDHDIRPVDLIGADLTGADLNHADLTRPYLADANLTRAVLAFAHLRRGYLTRANLTGADLLGADLVRANLLGANLTDANLGDADLTNAALAAAYLTRAVLVGANLTGASLRGADLTGVHPGLADLTGASLDNARWPAGEPLPPGWELDPGSGRLKQPGARPLPGEAD